MSFSREWIKGDLLVDKLFFFICVHLLSGTTSRAGQLCSISYHDNVPQLYNTENPKLILKLPQLPQIHLCSTSILRGWPDASQLIVVNKMYCWHVLICDVNRAEVDHENSPMLPNTTMPRSSKRKSAQMVLSRIRKQLWVFFAVTSWVFLCVVAEHFGLFDQESSGQPAGSGLRQWGWVRPLQEGTAKQQRGGGDRRSWQWWGSGVEKGQTFCFWVSHSSFKKSLLD